METIDLDSWREFRPTVDAVRLRKVDDFVRIDPYYRNRVLFRGLGCSDWRPESTLERTNERGMPLSSYVRLAVLCANELQSATGRDWGLPSPGEAFRVTRELQQGDSIRLPYYDFLVYLRHCGFPSPLLDWTASPYIAAFFAFEGAGEADRVAVYAYIEGADHAARTPLGDPRVTVLGPYVSTHGRHFAQKAWYTVATRNDDHWHELAFCSHSSVFDDAPDMEAVLVKITMPASERLAALAELDDYNINHYTLFQTEDALVRTLAIKHIELEA